MAPPLARRAYPVAAGFSPFARRNHGQVEDGGGNGFQPCSQLLRNIGDGGRNLGRGAQANRFDAGTQGRQCMSGRVPTIEHGVTPCAAGLVEHGQEQRGAPVAGGGGGAFQNDDGTAFGRGGDGGAGGGQAMEADPWRRRPCRMGVGAPAVKRRPPR